MSALQINTRSSDVATKARSYDFADLHAAVLADPRTAFAVRAAVGILLAVAAVIMVAGVATQSAVAMIAGAFAVANLAGVLIMLLVPARPTRR